LNNPPYRPEQLKEPPLAGDEFLALLDTQRNEKYPDPPPFYQALFDGTLTREALQLWVKNHYHYWDHGEQFSTGAIFAKCQDEEVRCHVLRRLVNIEGKDIVNDLSGWTTPAYEELWLRFGEGLGLARDEITSWKPFTRSYFAVETLCLLSRWWEWSWLDGIAAFYAADQLGLEVIGRAQDALKRHFGLADEDLVFFTNYLGDVAGAIPSERDMLAYWACTTERQLTAARAFRARLDIEYQMVLPLHVAATNRELPLQVP
jgi:pyrroloquinoline quinone (PQQ) biosynthesis protein C